MKKQLLFTFSLMIASLSFAQIPTNGLVSSYRFEGSLLADSVGTNHLTSTNTTALTAGYQNIPNTGLVLNGDGMLGVSSADFQQESFTFSCWVKLSTVNYYQTFGNVRMNAGSFPYNSFILCAGSSINNNLTFFFNTDSYLSSGNPTTDLYLQDQTGALTYGTWYHVAASVNYDSGSNVSTIRLFKNGSQVNFLQTPGKIVYYGNPFTLGNIDGASNTNNGLKGSLDEVLFYNRALSQGEICEMYNHYQNTTCLLSVAAPSNLTASVNNNQVTLNWTDNSNNETYFRVATSTDGVNFANVLGDVAANTTTYSYAASNGTHYYRVYAYNTYDDSPNSNIVSVTVSSTAGLEENTTIRSVYPNPSNRTLTIEVSEPIQAVITSVSGVKMAEIELNGSTTVTIENYAAGVYFIHTPNGQTYRFVKQ